MLQGKLKASIPFINCEAGKTVSFEINVTNKGQVIFPKDTTLCLTSPLPGNDYDIVYPVCDYDDL